MNAGYNRSHGDIFIPLNTDAVLHPHFIQASVDLFEQQPQLGVIAPEVYKIASDGPWRFWQAPHQLQSEGGVVALNTLLRVQVLLDHSDNWRPSFKANGACPVIRRSLLAAMQHTFGSAPFDPVFDTYGEDVDFAFKAWSLRWRTMFARHIVAGHVRSYASALELPDKRGRLRINLIAERYINAIRHLPLPRMLKVVVLALSEDVQMLVRQLTKRDRHIVRDLLTGWRRVLNMLPDLGHFRRQHHTWQTIDFDAEVYCRSQPLWFVDPSEHADTNTPSPLLTTFDEERTR
jgi:GT2 family glycosyltransferase